MHFENSKRVLIFFSGLVIFTIASEFDDDCSSDLTLVRERIRTATETYLDNQESQRTIICQITVLIRSNPDKNDYTDCLRIFREAYGITPRTLRKYPEEMMFRMMESLKHEKLLPIVQSCTEQFLNDCEDSGVKWSAEELSNWLDAHESERDQLSLVSGALGRYCNIIRQQAGRNFDPVYAVMAELIERFGER